ncbi:serine hydrolase [Thermopolyspora flexuosa]|uniref:Beta-lactamase family protein n=1 Tax=Thermopolyspora flexuosa TaxID=103836 RepID=A0A543IXP1_9ACTN|nr:serine hydrolase [Thermopolyspora flexuosa]TQM75317.1 beta-lactamase family protein [Thermopolyspora flexuosa]
MNVFLSALLTAALAAPAGAVASAADEFKDAESVLAYLKAHRDDVALVAEGIRHNADRLAPVASAIKIVHLAAYADAVRSGKVSPRERVKVSRWNAYHVPGTDGGAHEAALKRLKPGATVTLDQLVSAMIEESDNAAADLLRDRLGPAALKRIAGTPVGTFNGEILRAFAGCRLSADACLKRHVAGHRMTPVLPSFERQAAWAETVNRVRPAVLRDVLARLAKDPTARKHLEWPMRQPGADPGTLVIGTKGGSLPGVLSEATYTVRPGERPRHTVLALRRMPERTWFSAMQSYAHQRFMLQVATDPAFRARVRAALK